MERFQQFEDRLGLGVRGERLHQVATTQQQAGRANSRLHSGKNPAHETAEACTQHTQALGIHLRATFQPGEGTAAVLDGLCDVADGLLHIGADQAFLAAGGSAWAVVGHVHDERGDVVLGKPQGLRPADHLGTVEDVEHHHGRGVLRIYRLEVLGMNCVVRFVRADHGGREREHRHDHAAVLQLVLQLEFVGQFGCTQAEAFGHGRVLAIGRNRDVAFVRGGGGAGEEQKPQEMFHARASMRGR